MEDVILSFKDKNGMFYHKIKISDNIETEKETGYLYCKNSILGHIGKQAYNGYEVGIIDKKVVYVKREEQDVFDEDSLASIKGKPVTSNHPDEMVNSKNFKKYVVGFIGDVRRDGDNIVGDIVINDMDSIEKILDGTLKDLSLGYTAELVPTGDGELKQTNIVINHLALVAEGRAINARIVDEQTIVEETPIVEPIIVQEETPIVVQDAIVEENIENGENKKLKTFKEFMAEFKEVQLMPKSDFRDKAYQALNVECKESLQVDLPELDPKVVVVKDNAIENSVGLADNQTQVEETNKPKIAVLDAVGEEKWFSSLYRKMQNKDVAKKYADYTYHDVQDMLEGRNK